MRLVGLRWSAVWVSWWLRLIIVYAVTSLYIAFVCKLTLAPNMAAPNPFVLDKALLQHTHLLTMFALLLVYSAHVATFTIFLAQLFNKRIKIFANLITLSSLIDFCCVLCSSVQCQSVHSVALVADACECLRRRELDAGQVRSVHVSQSRPQLRHSGHFSIRTQRFVSFCYFTSLVCVFRSSTHLRIV